ncbi:ABC transporter permease [Algimonas porphyrae]|uniref:ABC transporter n=1 Tax=Algimonas porphyrae TaxID=1128113 RepID=A0ABQ5UYM9_9PROT|nr:ABC transporter permease [Algimonas porphyrae]GLQ20415.1 ABC transporter [Algimonas porphyrae]
MIGDFARLLQAEWLKLRRSLIWLLILAVPLMVFLLGVAIIATGNSTDQWDMLAMSGAAIWSFFLLPMTATALTALVAQLEHGARGWSYMLALPHRKTAVFAAKAVIVLAVMALISALVALANLGSGLVAGWIAPDQAMQGALPLALSSGIMGKMWLTGLLVVAIQFAVAMRYRSFAVPVVVGIAGTFVAVVATSAQQGLYFPWLMATNILNTDPSKATQALLMGSLGGLIVFALSIIWLSRRDWH